MNTRWRWRWIVFVLIGHETRWVSWVLEAQICKTCGNRASANIIAAPRVSLGTNATCVGCNWTLSALQKRITCELIPNTQNYESTTRSRMYQRNLSPCIANWKIVLILEPKINVYWNHAILNAQSVCPTYFTFIVQETETKSLRALQN